ncbi:MAG TPA: TonB-dependent receptor [Steroidobacteraceae bacterium]|nr:TonB-dependent receptor [Steroidobacteraceae bacterium]
MPAENNTALPRSLALLMGLAATRAIAQTAGLPAAEPAPDGLQEIVVTATKTQQKLQDVPMSITAFSAADIERNGFQSIQDWGNRLPNLTFQADDQSRTDLQTSVQIRGVSGAGTTGFYIDESPLTANLNPRVMDLERIEVLRGPQGTLYGARSMGGTVRFITAQPDLSAFSVSVRSQVSDTEHGSTNELISAVTNVPVVSGTFALRMLAYSEYDSGWLQRTPLPDAPYQFAPDKGLNSNRYSGAQITGLLSLLGGDLTITPRLLYQKHDADGRSESDIYAGNLDNARLFDIAEPGGSHWILPTLTITYRQPYGTFVAASTYFRFSDYDTEDGSEVLNQLLGTATPVPGVLEANDDNDEFSQELRFTSSFQGPLHVSAGLFFERTKTLVSFPQSAMQPLTNDLFSLYNPSVVKEKAAYTEDTLDITSHLSVIAGVRYFDNDVSYFSQAGGLLGDGVPYAGQEKQKGVTPKYGVQYHIDADRMLYADAAKGYRIGGVNGFAAGLCASGLASIGLTAQQAESYDSDSLWSYEAGAKTSWLDHRLTVNAAGFVIDWKNLQQVLGLGSCGYQATVNVGAARSEGGEVEMAWKATRSLQLSLGGGYTEAYITNNGGLSGNAAAVGSPVQNVPRWTANSAADFDSVLWGLPAFLHADYAFVGRSYDDRNAPRTRPEYSLLNLRGGVQVNNWQWSLFIQNLTDRAADFGDVPPMTIQLPGRPRIAVSVPRTIGVEARVAF